MSEKSSIGKKLSLLLFQKGIRAMDLAREIDVPQPTLHRIITGKSKKPHQETLLKIADFFNVDIARLLESHESDELKAKIAPGTHEIPLLTIEEYPLVNKQQALKHLLVTTDISIEAFAILLTDESLLPIFDKGTTLIFDPQKTPGARSYVFVSLGTSGNNTIRQLLTDGEHRFLKPLNPELARLSIKIVAEEDQILGTLVEARQCYF